MARTRYTFEKRQRELAKQQKKKDKALRRAEAKQHRQDKLLSEDGAEGTAENQGVRD
ncbi:MAG: hypothetical protein N2Z74_09690 [Syntrophales bacterium]|nr:hypothetical protein [Syntrophales bacterium]